MTSLSIPHSEPGKTRVLYLISSFSQGGAERHLLEVIRSLTNRNDQADGIAEWWRLQAQIKTPLSQ